MTCHPEGHVRDSISGVKGDISASENIDTKKSIQGFLLKVGKIAEK